MSRSRKDDGQGGLTRYEFGQWGGLMTANQLEIMGYRTGAHLPPRAGYYWREASKHPRRDAGPVFLYDPAQATRRKEVNKLRVTMGANQVQWPVALIGFLDRYAAAHRERLDQEGSKGSYSSAIQEELSLARRDLVPIASCLLFGAFDESLTGACITITFPPALFRRRYEDVTNWRVESDLWSVAEWIGQAYERMMRDPAN